MPGVCFEIENVFYPVLFLPYDPSYTLAYWICNCLTSFATYGLLDTRGLGELSGFSTGVSTTTVVPATRVGHFLPTLAIGINATNQKVFDSRFFKSAERISILSAGVSVLRCQFFLYYCTDSTIVRTMEQRKTGTFLRHNLLLRAGFWQNIRHTGVYYL